MKKTLSLLTSLTLAASASTFAADNSNQSSDANQNNTSSSSPQVNIKDVSYIIGHEIGKGFEQQNVKINEKSFMQGLKEGQAGKKSKYSSEKMKQQMRAFQAKMQKKAREEEQKEAKINKEKSQKYMKKIAQKDDINKLASGVYYKVDQKGSSGKENQSQDHKKASSPGLQDTVEFNYKGMIPTRKQNNVFGNSYNQDEPVTAQMRQLIPCWQEALKHMKPGDKWTLYCSADKAYGKQAPAVIGPEQALKFNITLIDFKKSKGEEVVVEEKEIVVEEKPSDHQQSSGNSNHQSQSKNQSNNQ